MYEMSTERPGGRTDLPSIGERRVVGVVLVRGGSSGSSLRCPLDTRLELSSVRLCQRVWDLGERSRL